MYQEELKQMRNKWREELGIDTDEEVISYHRVTEEELALHIAQGYQCQSMVRSQKKLR